MKRFFIASSLTSIVLLMSVSGCTRASALCAIICECEHCSDQTKSTTCDDLAIAEDVAASYDCTAKFELLADCVEQRGTCEEKDAEFSLTTDTGENRCQDEKDALQECMDNASAHDAVDLF